MLAAIHSRGTVGTLRPIDGVLEFEYARHWLKRADAFPLSPRLALRDEPWRGDEVAFFFANLLPEGPVLDALLQLRRLPRGNLYRLLEAFGRECAGAFSIVPEAEVDNAPGEPCYTQYSRRQLTADLAKLRDNIPLLGSHAKLRLSLAGAQNKIPVRYADGQLSLPVGNAPTTHILKPALQPVRLFPHSVLNEAFCLRLAGALGMQVPNIVVLQEPEPVLLIERYDRKITNGNVERLHQLDLCQLDGVLPANKYESDGGPGYRECFAMIDAFSASPAVDRLRLVDWTIFNYLVGNADAHAKNLSMLYGVGGHLRLAPAYDLLATSYWKELSDKMAMAIGGERRPAWVHARHWQRLCEGVGLNAAQLRVRARDLCAKAMTLKDDVAAALEVPAPLTKHLSMTLEQGADRIDKRLGVVE
jgi:serine/threonine-protein kinase HipA